MTTKEVSFFEKLNHRLRNSISIKMISIGILILILLIPATMIQSLINERQSTSEAAINEVSSKWGNEQVITGPVVIIPYKTTTKNSQNEYISTTDYAYFLPNKLNIKGEIFPQKRKRGIYEIIVYNARLEVSGTLPKPDFSEWSIPENDINWKDAFISIGIPDMRGIKDNIILHCGDENISLNSGIEANALMTSGVSARIPAEGLSEGKEFSFKININGSKSLKFVPLGKETKVSLKSPWENPSFDGAFLPDNRIVNNKGFSAEWKILDLNRNYPQKWHSSSYNIYDSYFGVSLIIPVDHYQKSLRTAKYAILIISLTFLVFFFIELLNKKRVHPFQYLLVGLSLCLFYSLLLSISEHLSFNLSYCIASVATIISVSLFSKSIFKSLKTGFFIASILVVLYTFIFVIIQLQDYALLMGSTGLFIVLAFVMYISRKISWTRNDNEITG